MERTQFIVEADIKGFFNHVGHDWMHKFLNHRITDNRLLRVIHRFLKAGVMEDGVISASEEGTPQGGLVSPILSNVYLHYVLDLWFEKRFARHCRGKAFLVRYCDDFVACFQLQEDAERFMAELPNRLGNFNLEIEPTKTQLIRFGTQAARTCNADGLRRPKTFSFLGFTHFVTKSRRGNFLVGRRTEAKRIRNKLKELNLRMSELRVKGGRAMLDFAKQHFQGHLQYYGVSGNLSSVERYLKFTQRLLFKWLNRRSQKRSMAWPEFREYLKASGMPRPRIVRNLYDFFPSRKTQ